MNPDSFVAAPVVMVAAVIKVFLNVNTERKINGIKWLRTVFDIGLKEAKDAWEAIEYTGYCLVTSDALFPFVIEDDRDDTSEEPWVLQIDRIETVPLVNRPEFAADAAYGQSPRVTFKFANGWGVQLYNADSISYVSVRVFNEFGKEESCAPVYAGQLPEYLREVERRRNSRYCDLTQYQAKPLSIVAAMAV